MEGRGVLEGGFSVIVFLLEEAERMPRNRGEGEGENPKGRTESKLGSLRALRTEAQAGVVIFHFHVSHASRAEGRSSVAMAAYRAGAMLIDAGRGRSHDYRRKAVLYSELVLPAAAPDWARDRGELWNRSEAAHRRKDAIVAREIELSLPHELEEDERRKLGLEFARYLSGRFGVAVDACFHPPSPNGDRRNYHVHFLLCTRPFDASSKTGFGAINREFDAVAQQRAGSNPVAEELRRKWAGMLNRAVTAADPEGVGVRVDHRSYEQQGLEREPTIKEGAAATAMKRRGEHSDRAALNDEIRQSNAGREIVRRSVAAWPGRKGNTAPGFPPDRRQLGEAIGLPRRMLARAGFGFS